MPERHIYTVSAINDHIKTLLESNFSGIWLEGEISNFVHHTSGHMYFSLKDENAEIKAVMWKGVNRSLRFRPEDGMKAIIQGDISVYSPRGQYQIIVNQLQPAGVGELQLAFEQLKERLQSEGLFDDDRKRPLPAYPLTIGVVSSATGAAFRDILNVLNRRAPYVRVILAPAKVQGKGAAEEIAHGIELLNSIPEIDVLIIGRGGGSLEDLWPFNEESVARAVVASRLPVVSAVGHEVDFSISDFSADYRAPTPSAAAEIVARDTAELTTEIVATQQYLRNSLRDQIGRLRSRLKSVQTHYAFQLPKHRIATVTQQIDELTTAMENHIIQLLQQQKQRINQHERSLELLHPKNTLRRGYSITRDQHGKVIRNTADLQIKSYITSELSQGELKSQVTEIRESNEQ